jgi:uncharacterized repeat protein (TIGR01451 family)
VTKTAAKAIRFFGFSLLVRALITSLLWPAQPARAQACTPGAQPGDVLDLSKTATPDPVTVGQPLTFTLRVDNNTPCPAVAIVEDELPASVRFVSARTDPGQGDCAQSSGEVGRFLVIEGNGSAPVEIVVIPTAPELITNTAFELIFGSVARATVCVQTTPDNDARRRRLQLPNKVPTQRPSTKPRAATSGKRSRLADKAILTGARRDSELSR